MNDKFLIIPLKQNVHSLDEALELMKVAGPLAYGVSYDSRRWLDDDVKILVEHSRMLGLYSIDDRRILSGSDFPKIKPDAITVSTTTEIKDIPFIQGVDLLGYCFEPGIDGHRPIPQGHTDRFFNVFEEIDFFHLNGSKRPMVYSYVKSLSELADLDGRVIDLEQVSDQDLHTVSRYTGRNKKMLLMNASSDSPIDIFKHLYRPLVEPMQYLVSPGINSVELGRLIDSYFKKSENAA